MTGDTNRPRSLRDLVDPIVIAAFSGWNDAGVAASQAMEHLQDVTDAEELFALDPDDFYDFQVNRPTITRDTPTESTIDWPTTTVSIGRLGAQDLVLIEGPEPNFRWRAFTNQLMSALRSTNPAMVLVLGALLADTPHSRPIPVTGSVTDLLLAERLGMEVSTYEGPTGIVGLFAKAGQDAGHPTVSLWAAVPHYVSQSPCPKASLALLHRLEDLLDSPIDQGDLPELARAWERGVAELASDDAEIAEYVAGLEQEQDESELPEATGDAIAAEFMRYLRRRDR
ncbi:PAC2 family protein [Propionibacteriaceae bacterium Y1700]|uniref:PAC2 family protein n=1 Tax=Microlunatus sp. Y1700 TaxID=3418487 RepID=UPI003DA6F203